MRVLLAALPASSAAASSAPDRGGPPGQPASPAPRRRPSGCARSAPRPRWPTSSTRPRSATRSRAAARRRHPPADRPQRRPRRGQRADPPIGTRTWSRRRGRRGLGASSRRASPGRTGPRVRATEDVPLDLRRRARRGTWRPSPRSRTRSASSRSGWCSATACSTGRGPGTRRRTMWPTGRGGELAADADVTQLRARRRRRRRGRGGPVVAVRRGATCATTSRPRGYAWVPAFCASVGAPSPQARPTPPVQVRFCRAAAAGREARATSRAPRAGLDPVPPLMAGRVRPLRVPTASRSESVLGDPVIPAGGRPARHLAPVAALL